MTCPFCKKKLQWIPKIEGYGCDCGFVAGCFGKYGYFDGCKKCNMKNLCEAMVLFPTNPSSREFNPKEREKR